MAKGCFFFLYSRSEGFKLSLVFADATQNWSFRLNNVLSQAAEQRRSHYCSWSFFSWSGIKDGFFKKCKNEHFQHLMVQHLARYSRKDGATDTKASELAVYSGWHPWWCLPVSWRVPRTSHPPPHPSLLSLLSVSCSQLLYLQPSLCCLLVLFDVEHKERTKATDLCCPPFYTRLVPVAMKQRCLLSFIHRKCISKYFPLWGVSRSYDSLSCFSFAYFILKRCYKIGLINPD